MAAAAAQQAWMPQLAGPQRVEIGSSLRRALKARSGTAQDGALDQRSKRLPDNDYYSFRYRFRPTTVDPHKTGTLEHRADEPNYTLLRPSDKGDNISFTSTERPAKAWDCILIYDEETGALSLEKIDSHFEWLHTGFAATASAPSSNGAAPRSKNNNSLALPLASSKPQPSHDDQLLAADLERELQDDDASGESYHEYEPVDLPPVASTSRAKPKSNYASYPTEETFDLVSAAPPPPRPGKGKGVARVEAAAKAQKPAAKARGKKRKAAAEDDEFEPVAIPAPAPARAPKRKKSSPPPPPPPPPPIALALPPRPQELLVPPPARPPPEYTSSEDEADMLEEVPIPPPPTTNGHANHHLEQQHIIDDEFIEIDPGAEQNEDFDQFALELEQAMEEEPEQPVEELEVDGDDAQLADDIFGDMVDQEDEDDMEEATYGEEVQMNGNGYLNGHTNGQDPAAPLYPAYDDTSSDDSDDDDDD